MSSPRWYWTESPAFTTCDPTDLLLGYLDTYRATVRRKLDGLSAAQLTTAPAPLSWSPLGLVCHLAAMERRWLCWGFLAEDIADPYDDRVDGRWRVPESAAAAFDTLDAQAARTRDIVTGTELSSTARVGGLFTDPTQLPTLAWILHHVLQEYSRHVGQLDVARELIDGTTGE